MPHLRHASLIALLGGLLLSACGSTASRGSVTVNVTLKEFSVQSSVTDFQPGVPYHFIVKNEGQIPHEFMIMPMTMQGMHMPGMPEMSMEERDQAALMMIPEEQLKPGAVVEADYTFETAPRDTDIEIVCTLPGHLEAGMHKPVRIN